MDEAYRSRRWVFAYDKADEIIGILKHQLSSMLKGLLTRPQRSTTDPVARALRLLKSPHPRFREDAVKTLVEYNAVSELLEGLAHGRPEVREAAARGAAQLKLPEAIPYLIGGLACRGRRDREPVIRNAEECLQSYSDAAVRALLEQMPSSIDYSESPRWVRAIAGALTPVTVLEVLEAARKSKRWTLLEAALKSKIPLAKAAIAPAINEYVRSKDSWSFRSITQWLSESSVSDKNWVNQLVKEWVVTACQSIPQDAKNPWEARELVDVAHEMRAVTATDLAALVPSIANPSLLEHIRKLAGMIPSPALGASAATAAEQVTEQALMSQLSSESSTARRKALFGLGKLAQPRFVPALITVLERETNQNVRESAIKALGSIGGGSAAAKLEEIWFGKEASRFGKQAAQNALRELGLWRGDAPIFDPRDLKSTIHSILCVRTQYEYGFNGTAAEMMEEIAGRMRATTHKAGHANVQAGKEEMMSDGLRLTWSVEWTGRRHKYPRVQYSLEFSNAAMADRLVPWGPAEWAQFSGRTSCVTRIAATARRARQLGLDVELLLDDRIRVAGSNWPMFGRTQRERQFHIELKTIDGGSQVSFDRFPKETCQTWTECTQVVIRLSRWLADGKQQRDSLSRFGT